MLCTLHLFAKPIVQTLVAKTYGASIVISNSYTCGVHSIGFSYSYGAPIGFSI